VVLELGGSSSHLLVLSLFFSCVPSLRGQLAIVPLFINIEKSMLIHSLLFSYGILNVACVKSLVA